MLNVFTENIVARTMLTTQEGLLISTGQRAACEMRILPVGVGVFRPEFYGNGVVPCHNVDTVRGPIVYCNCCLIALQLCRRKLLDNETL